MINLCIFDNNKIVIDNEKQALLDEGFGEDEPSKAAHDINKFMDGKFSQIP